ncbi:MAG: uroporphyrinogen decarboxylase family protein [Eubacteriales bacterium]|nr:uroporphyrinogen decarboxylase family protein [Eubacteriales bacterium]
MNKRERVLAAMNNQLVDRPPVGFWFHFTGEKGMGQACVQAHLDYYNHIDVDIVKVMCDGYFPYPIEETITCAADWRKLKPLPADHPFIEEQVARAKAIRAGLRDDMCMFYNVFAPFSYIRFGSSEELVMRTLREDPDAVMAALDAIGQSCVTLARRLCTEGTCDGLYYCVQGGEKNRFTPEEYRKYITPSDKLVLEGINPLTDNNILHCCGWAGDANNLEVWRDYPVKCFNWAAFIENLSVPEGKRFFGGKCVLAGFDNRVSGPLFSGNRQQIEALTDALLDETQGLPGIMLGADCTLPAEVDVQHFQWVEDAVKRRFA